KDLRRRAGPLRARKQAVDRSALRIAFASVGERKQIDWKQDVEVLQRVARRLAEPVVERSASGAADLIEHAVEHPATLFVFVEALIYEVAEETAALRHAPADRERHP